jgi:hypothetical protein
LALQWLQLKASEYAATVRNEEAPQAEMDAVITQKSAEAIVAKRSV